jgi:hypothetical protein
MAPTVEDELTASDAAVHVVCGSWDNKTGSSRHGMPPKRDAAVHVVCGSWDKEAGFAPWDSSQARTGHHDSPQDTSKIKIE